MRHLSRYAIVVALLGGCATDPVAPVPSGGAAPPGPAPVTPAPVTPAPVLDTAPAPQREFRGVWVATVANIDWPSRTTLTAAQQQAEYRQLLLGFRQTRLNAVILQIRPNADALYPSAIEPWSRVLTGTQGRDPGYDPLAFAATETHAAGLELHAWFNPFRAGNTRDTATFADTHIWRVRRDLTRVYGSQVWMDPGEPEVQERAIQVVTDVVRRYDVDAVHLDDYFYPYIETDAQGRAIPFPDDASYARLNPRGLTRADWRRDNVNRFVERLYREVHAVKPWVRVGISPFGIWRPASAGGPAGIVGLDAFAEIYADSKLWLNSGWVDYLAPQLYWRIDPPQQSYPVLLNWWASQNTQRRHLWPGNAGYRVADGTTSAFPADEIPRQIAVTRGVAGVTGNIFYNTTSLFARASDLSRTLSTGVYAAGTAVPPATPWLDPTPPGTPVITVTEAASPGPDRVWTVRITPAAGEPARWWVTRAKVGGQWASATLVWAGQLVVEQATASSVNGGRLDAMEVRAADAVWNLSGPAIWRQPSLVVTRVAR